MSRFRRRLLSQDNDFEELEYIESTGVSKQWIDTGIIPNMDSSINIKFKYLIDSFEGCPFGVRDSTTANNAFYIFQNNRYNTFFGFGNLRYNYEINSFTNITDVKLDKISLTINDNIYAITPNNFSVSTRTLYLFGMNEPKYTYERTREIRIYYSKIYNGDTLIQDLIPVRKKSSDTVCMYDKVTKKFFYNQGTGNFIAGSVKYNTMVTDGLIDEWINPKKTVEDSKWIGTVNGEELELCGNACVENNKVELKDNEGIANNIANSWLNINNTNLIKTIIIKYKQNIKQDSFCIIDCKIRWFSNVLRSISSQYINNIQYDTSYFIKDSLFNNKYNIISASFESSGNLVSGVIGKNTTTNGYGLNASIEAIYLYDRVLTPEEHSQMYHYINDEKPYAYETEYLESTGTQYINTKINATGLEDLEVALNLTNYDTAYCGILGSQIGNTNDKFSLFYRKADGFQLRCLGATSITSLNFNKTKNILTVKDSKFLINNNLISNYTKINTENFLPLTLFGVIDNTSFKYMIGKIFYSKIWDNNSKLQQYLIPVITKTGEACMYDKVSRKLFKNQGTGSFIAPRSNTKAVNRAIGTQDSFSFVPNNTVNQYIDIYKINKSVFSVNNYVSVFFTLIFENCEFNDNCYVRDVISNLNFSSVIGLIGKIQNGIFNYFGTKLITDDLYKPDRDNNFGLRCDYIGGENAKITISNLTVVQGDTPLLEWKPAPEDTPRPNLLRQSGNFLKMPDDTWWVDNGGGKALDLNPDNMYGNYYNIRTNAGNGVKSKIITNIIPEEIYTYSITLKSNNNFNYTYNSPVRIWCWKDNDMSDVGMYKVISYKCNYDTANEWCTLYTTFKSKNGANVFLPMIFNSLSNTSIMLNIANMKLELGSNATPWVPNELDVPNTSNIIFKKYTQSYPLSITSKTYAGNNADSIYFSSGTYKCTFKTDGTIFKDSNMRGVLCNPEDKACGLLISKYQVNNYGVENDNDTSFTFTINNPNVFYISPRVNSDGETPVTVNFWDIVIEKTA